VSRENVEVVWLMFDAFNRGDVEGFAAALTEDATIVPLRAALEDTVYQGPDAARDFWADAMEAWSELRVDLEDVRDCGDRCLALGSIKGKARGSDAVVQTPAAWIAQVRGGRFAEVRTYTSHEEALEAVGLRE